MRNIRTSNIHSNEDVHDDVRVRAHSCATRQALTSDVHSAVDDRITDLPDVFKMIKLGTLPEEWGVFPRSLTR